ncbi:MAG: DUF302 domain-containing protein [Pseudomonadota bacterium]
MKFHLLVLIAMIVLTGCTIAPATQTPADNGLIKIRSANDVETTTQRLLAALENAGMTHFATVDHTEGAEAAGLALRPTRVVIFGNPKAGTPLMRCAQTIGIDLPMKALIFEAESGEVFYTYNKIRYLGDRHAITGCGPVLEKVESALANFATAATSS